MALSEPRCRHRPIYYIAVAAASTKCVLTGDEPLILRLLVIVLDEPLLVPVDTLPIMLLISALEI